MPRPSGSDVSRPPGVTPDVTVTRQLDSDSDSASQSDRQTQFAGQQSPSVTGTLAVPPGRNGHSDSDSLAGSPLRARPGQPGSPRTVAGTCGKSAAPAGPASGCSRVGAGGEAESRAVLVAQCSAGRVAPRPPGPPARAARSKDSASY